MSLGADDVLSLPPTSREQEPTSWEGWRDFHHWFCLEFENIGEEEKEELVYPRGRAEVLSS